MPELHIEVLPADQRRLWNLLRTEANFLNGQGYYLAGGSALALQIGHRQSVDFDFFSSQKELSSLTEKWLGRFSRVIIRDLDPDTLHAEVEGVKASFISAYKYPTVGALIDAEGIKLAGLIDIGLMKLLAVTHRATLRDYIDLAALLRGPVTLEHLLEASSQKYGQNFNPMPFLRALVTFQDVDLEMPVLIDRTLETSWQKILSAAVKKAS